MWRIGADYPCASGSIRVPQTGHADKRRFSGLTRIIRVNPRLSVFYKQGVWIGADHLAGVNPSPNTSSTSPIMTNAAGSTLLTMFFKAPISVRATTHSNTALVAPV